MKRIILSLLILCSSCSDDDASTWPLTEPRNDLGLDLPDTDTEPSDFDQVFIGIWRVDQPAHAGYEATFYEFGEAGVLKELESQEFGSGQIPTGRVAGCDEFQTDQCVSCVFADKWAAVDARTLLITTDCDDGQKRDITLRFENDPLAAFAGMEISFQGQTNWHHNDFAWDWTKCSTLEECRSF